MSSGAQRMENMSLDSDGESAAASAEKLSIAVCQLTSIDDVSANLDQIFERLASLESDVPDFITLPENALYLRLRDGAPIDSIDLRGDEIRALSEWVIRHRAVLHIGSIPVREQNKLYNSSIVLTPDGGVADVYRKIHLFDVDVEGHRPMRESDVFAYGDKPSVFEVKGWKFGASICYDIRFPELFLRYARRGVDVILVPAAFLVPTGQAHWEILTRARAIESQAYLLAAAQGGEHHGTRGGVRRTYGYSMVVDPWGVVLASTGPGGGETGVLRSTLERARLRSVRAQIPMARHRRLD